MERNIYKIGKELFITNDEEIKEGIDQWYLDKVLNEPYNSGGAQYSSKQDVIILTTDQDLIKDGVQAIDDEFLEWFVKNPTCEKVEIDKLSVRNITGYGAGGDVECYYTESYKIIIPKEEPKQELHLNWWKSLSTWYLKTEMMKKHGYDFKLVDEDIDLHPDDIKIIWGKEQKQETLEETFNFQEKLVEYFNNTPREKILEDWDKSVEYDKIGPTMEEFLESKQDYKKLSKKFTETLNSIPDDVLIKYTQQETLEEAGENYTKDGTKHYMEKTNVQLGFIEGTKWQARRMYSEKEVLEILNIFNKHTLLLQKLKLGNSLDVKDWFNEFKKK